MRSSLLRWVFCLSAGAGLFGCQDSKDDFIARGRKAAQQEKFQEAQGYFDEVLKQDPSNYSALWGKADTYRREGKLVEQAKTLEQIMSNKDNENRANVIKALETNYRQQAEALVASDDVQAEALLRKAIDLDKRSEASTTLGQLLMRRGDNLIRKAQFADAKKAFDAALELRIDRKLRAEVTGKAEVTEFLAFKTEFAPRFDKVKGELITAGVYNEKEHIFIVDAEGEVQGEPEDEGFEKAAETAGLAAVTTALAELTWKVSGTPKPEGALVFYDSALVTVIEKGLTDKKKPRTFRFKVSLPADAVFDQVRKVEKGEFKTAAPAAAPAEGQPAPDAGQAAPAQP